MSYISHEDYKAMMAKFQASSSKGMLKESVEEGNAFTAVLARTPKGGEAKVGGKKIKDTSNYDAKLEGYADNYAGSWGYREGLEEAGAGDAPISKMSRKDMIEFLGTTEEKAKGMSDDELRDAVAEKNEDMKEGLHMPPLQATDQTIDTVEENSIIDAPFGVANRGTKTQLEGPGLQLSNLTTDERKQLGEFVEAVKTTKGAIEKLLEKASGKKVKVKETMGGDRTGGLVLPVSENLEGAVQAISRIEEIVSNLSKNISASRSIPPVEKKGLVDALEELGGLVEDLGYDIEFGQMQAGEDMRTAIDREMGQP